MATGVDIDNSNMLNSATASDGTPQGIRIAVVGDATHHSAEVSDLLKLGVTKTKDFPLSIIDSTAKSGFMLSKGLSTIATVCDAFIAVVTGSSPSSVHNVDTLWIPEIRSMCPARPIVVVSVSEDREEKFLYQSDHSSLSSSSIKSSIRIVKLCLPRKNIAQSDLDAIKVENNSAVARILAFLVNEVTVRPPISVDTGNLTSALENSLHREDAVVRASSLLSQYESCVSDLTPWNICAAPAVFRHDWEDFVDKVIRFQKSTVVLMCDAMDKDRAPASYNATGPCAGVEYAVEQTLYALDKGRSNVQRVVLRFDVDTAVCISVIIGLVKHFQVTADTCFRTIVGEEGELSIITPFNHPYFKSDERTRSEILTPNNTRILRV